MILAQRLARSNLTVKSGTKPEQQRDYRIAENFANTPAFAKS